MNIGKIIFGIILLTIIPTHWFLGGIVLSALTGFPAMVIVGLWLMLILGGISLIFSGLNEPDNVVGSYKVEKYPHKKEFETESHRNKNVSRDQYPK